MTDFVETLQTTQSPEILNKNENLLLKYLIKLKIYFNFSWHTE